MSANLTQDLIDFIYNSPSCFHVSENFCKMLDEAGFIRLSESEEWTLEPGKSYYVSRNMTTLAAFRIPEGPVKSFMCAGAHLDSPTFRLKGNMEMHSAGYTRLNVEKYGGMVCAPWYDRPLSVAGKILVEENGCLVSRLVNVDRDLLVIPHLAIHMNRAANSGENISVQTDMIPLYGDETAAGTFMDTVAATAGHKGSDVLGFDLFLYLRTKGTIWGANNEFFSSPRLDDLQCAYALVQGILNSTNARSIPVCMVFDNEEVGSTTKAGAKSDFFTVLLQRIADCLGMSFQQYRAALASSFMVSADNAHAKHPNHPEKADPTTYPMMNKGPVLKFHGGQKYATDSVSAAIFRTVCANAGVSCQMFCNHSDMTSGSTLGNLATSNLSLNTIDVGLAQLAMHSPYETAGVRDLGYLTDAMIEYFGSSIEMVAPESWRVTASRDNH